MGYDRYEERNLNDYKNNYSIIHSDYHIQLLGYP